MGERKGQKQLLLSFSVEYPSVFSTIYTRFRVRLIKDADLRIYFMDGVHHYVEGELPHPRPFPY
jgi:hypothetical protein